MKYKTEKELRGLLAEKRDLARELRFKASERQLKDASKIKRVRKDVARILTMLEMRKSGHAKQVKVEQEEKITK